MDFYLIAYMIELIELNDADMAEVVRDNCDEEHDFDVYFDFIKAMYATNDDDIAAIMESYKEALANENTEAVVAYHKELTTLVIEEYNRLS